MWYWGPVRHFLSLFLLSLVLIENISNIIKFTEGENMEYEYRPVDFRLLEGVVTHPFPPSLPLPCPLSQPPFLI
jgi:hypothetical protein